VPVSCSIRVILADCVCVCRTVQEGETRCVYEQRHASVHGDIMPDEQINTVWRRRCLSYTACE